MSSLFLMRGERAGNRGRLARGALALLIMLCASVTSASLSSAAPSQEDVQAAKEKLDALNQRLGILVEEYDQEQVKLQEIQSRLAVTRAEAAKAHAAALAAMGDLNARATRAYQGLGSELEMLLGATSFAEFSDRLEFMGAIAQADTDLANRAATAQQQATWIAAKLADALAQQQELLSSLQQKQSEIRRGIGQAKSLYESLNRQYHDALAASRAASAASASAYSISPPPSGPPPAPNANAQAALDAAYSMIGVPYQFGGSSPESGFDCSGFTMWAWAHAGVSLPHSSAMQYAVLPHVAQSDLQPGDLVFFYSPIHHVGIYVGGGSMIDSPHTGTVVQVRAVEWSVYVGAARP
jgi:cell wall-associated NlpC family hydrolase